MKRYLIFFISITTITLSTLLFSTTAVTAERDKEINRLMEMINDKRASGRSCGKEMIRPSRPLRWDKRLARAAFIHARDLANRDTLSHKGLDGSGPGERIRSSGYKWKAYGENVGEGYETPEDMLMAWLQSEGHCKNIMNPLFRDLGIARISDNKKTYWVLVLATSD